MTDRISQETGPLELYFFLGPSLTDALQQYHGVTGLPRMPPLAALGKHQSRWNYITPEDVMEVLPVLKVMENSGRREQKE